MRKAIAGTSNTSTVEARRRMWKTGLACAAEALCAAMTGAVAGASMPATQLPPACSGALLCATIGTGAMAVAAARGPRRRSPEASGNAAPGENEGGETAKPENTGNNLDEGTATERAWSEGSAPRNTRSRLEADYGDVLAQLEKLIEEELEEVGIVNLERSVALRIMRGESYREISEHISAPRNTRSRLEADYGDVLAQLEKLIEEELEEVGIVNLERSVALRIMRGESYREISEHIYYSENAVKYHAKRIFEKAQTSSRHEFEMLVRRNVEKRIGQVNATGETMRKRADAAGIAESRRTDRGNADAAPSANGVEVS